MAPNMGASQQLILFGKAKNAKNSAYIGYKHVEDGSTENTLTLGLYGVDQILNINGVGNVGIGTSAPIGKLHVNGGGTLPLIISGGAGNYREGIRIIPTGSWSDILLGGNDVTQDSGTSANSWFIGNNNGNFYISRNGSSGGTASLKCVSNVWSWNGTANGSVTAANQLNSIRTIGGSTFAEALKSNFNSYKSSTNRNVLLHYYSSAYGNGSAVFGYYLSGYDSSPYGGFYVCHYNSAKYVGIQNGTYTQYEITKSASSSRKVKENISLMTDEQANNLLNLSVINFDYKSNIEGGKKNQKGIIIEELIDIMPECIVNLDDYDGNNSEILQVDYTKFIPYLIKLCQEQQKEINLLKKGEDLCLT